MTPTAAPTQSRLLHNKTAVIYGARGAIGGAVARAFGREGATVFLTGRTVAKLDVVAKDIIASGAAAETSWHRIAPAW